jgi:hypothetical protein
MDENAYNNPESAKYHQYANQNPLVNCQRAPSQIQDLANRYQTSMALDQQAKYNQQVSNINTHNTTASSRQSYHFQQNQVYSAGYPPSQQGPAPLPYDQNHHGTYTNYTKPYQRISQTSIAPAIDPDEFIPPARINSNPAVRQPRPVFYQSPVMLPKRQSTHSQPSYSPVQPSQPYGAPADPASTTYTGNQATQLQQSYMNPNAVSQSQGGFNAPNHQQPQVGYLPPQTQYQPTSSGPYYSPVPFTTSGASYGQSQVSSSSSNYQTTSASQPYSSQAPPYMSQAPPYLSQVPQQAPLVEQYQQPPSLQYVGQQPRPNPAQRYSSQPRPNLPREGN